MRSKLYGISQGLVLGPRRPGYTLMELLVSVAIMTVLMGAMGVSVLMAVGSIDRGAEAGRQMSETNEALDEIVTELTQALSFIERTEHAVSFVVPDRDGDGLRDTIRYSWSGVAGDPVMREYNGQRPVPLAEDVHHFNLTYVLKIAHPPD